jgi:hypothetical protein
LLLKALLLLTISHAIVHAGVLAGLTAAICPFVQRMRELQQQAGLSPERAGQQLEAAFKQLVRAVEVMHALLCMWTHLVREGVLVPVAVRALPPLMRQLQRCSSLLIDEHTTSSSMAYFAVQELQYAAADLLCALDMWFPPRVQQEQQQQAVAELSAQACAVLQDAAVSEMLMQQLTACTMLLHQEHAAHHVLSKQQQVSAVQCSSSSSASPAALQQLQQQQQPRTALCAQLVFSVPAYHQGMAQLLPGGLAHTQAAAEVIVNAVAPGIGNLHGYLWHARECAVALQSSLFLRLHCSSSSGGGSSSSSSQQRSSSPPEVSAAAIKLVLELQLLAASLVQRQQQQGQQELQQLAARLVLISNTLLQRTVRVVLEVTSGRRLLPEVLQQAGLQLLQALAAPLQLLQLGSSDDLLSMSEAFAADEQPYTVLEQQLYLLRAVAARLAPKAEDVLAGEMQLS